MRKPKDIVDEIEAVAALPEGEMNDSSAMPGSDCHSTFCSTMDSRLTLLSAPQNLHKRRIPA